jgi:hypothetical protein
VYKQAPQIFRSVLVRVPKETKVQKPTTPLRSFSGRSKYLEFFSDNA